MVSGGVAREAVPPSPDTRHQLAGFVPVVSTSSSCVEREDELATKTKTRCDESARYGEMASNVTSVTMAHRLAQLALRDDLDVHHRFRITGPAC